jgi:hypothetical protein
MASADQDRSRRLVERLLQLCNVASTGALAFESTVHEESIPHSYLSIQPGAPIAISLLAGAAASLECDTSLQRVCGSCFYISRIIVI